MENEKFVVPEYECACAPFFSFPLYVLVSGARKERRAPLEKKIH